MLKPPSPAEAQAVRNDADALHTHYILRQTAVATLALIIDPLVRLHPSLWYILTRLELPVYGRIVFFCHLKLNHKMSSRAFNLWA